VTYWYRRGFKLGLEHGTPIKGRWSNHMRNPWTKKMLKHYFGLKKGGNADQMHTGTRSDLPTESARHRRHACWHLRPRLPWRHTQGRYHAGSVYRKPVNPTTRVLRPAGWTIVAEYVDRVSASGERERDQFKAMWESASRREFDILLVWALDRFAREGVEETFSYIKRLRDNGVHFVSFKEEHFRTTGAAGELMIAIAAWIAKQERVRLSERTKAGMDRARRSGALIGRPVQDIDQDELERLRLSGLSVRQIA